MIKQFSLDFQGDWLPRYNIAPTQQVPVVRGVDRTVSPLRWGLVPFWAKSPKDGARMINARSETVSTKPAFRAAAKSRRCLVLADGYFEWVREGKQKQPYWIRLQHEQPFAMAGLWEKWLDRTIEAATPLETFTILTTAANSLTADVHDRMPVILGSNDYDAWLDTDAMPPDELTYLYEPYAAAEMKLDAVSTWVNSVRHDDPRCVEFARKLF